MKWIDFERQMKQKNINLFTPLDVGRFLGRSKVATTFLIHRLKKQGYIESVKRGLFKFSDQSVSDLYLANRLYEPSYISLEFALSYYGVIPETVYEITSVSPKATRRFEALGKVYSYHRIKKTAFTGYAVQKQKGFSFAIADPEKAFVDTLYYRLLSGKKPLSRFNKDKINAAKALKYTKLFRNERLTSITKTTLR